MFRCAHTMPYNDGTGRAHVFTDIRAMGQCPSTTCEACSDSGADRYMIKRAISDPPAAAPTKDLIPDGNPHYPLLLIAAPPLPYVKPANVMEPTASEAESAVKRDTSFLPVARVRSCSAPVTLEKGVCHLPAMIKVGPILHSSTPHPSAFMSSMGPPPRPAKK